MKYFWILTLLITAISYQATAAPRNADIDDCFYHAGTNGEFSECSSKRVTWLTQQLDAKWTCMLEVDKDKTSRSYRYFVAEHAAWEAYKDSACQPFLYDHGREGVVLHYGACKAKIIEQRMEYLDAVYHGTACVSN